jgi:hypothetical protein
MYPALSELDPSVSAKRDEVTNEPCIALNRDPPKQLLLLICGMDALVCCVLLGILT